ncbi:helix-turn-helix transcriptional regulator [Kyrpidia tusciae]|uniref:Transcriptional regulator, XRE family n=1 Tax=Kyrpidia tusciae (strain DSM 2912 / NBRC 15312 / T2) TaxID=562970 RepID=D5WQM4_KYRT2|nr:helix-turn-helix transcriptional regulator [Kyrpidia tusciae]ADG06633.1 transcriptional regulator, XRE family [Kyrpidia tusciae DSM 2912]
MTGLTRLEILRRARGWTQTDVSRMIGVSGGLISHIERRVRSSYPKLRRALSELYGVPEESLFDDLGMARLIDAEALRRLAG